MSTPYFQDGPVTVYAGDCIEVLRSLPDASVHAVVCDPPYGLEFMGKEWDSFGRGEAMSNATAGMMRGGISAANGRPSFLGGLNPRCTICGKSQRGGSPCNCERPSFTDERGPRLRAFQSWCTDWAAECLRVLKPGGHLLAFGGSRTWHRLAAGVEDAGFEIRDSMAWIYAQGFPKSMNIRKDNRFCQCPEGESNGDHVELRGVRSAVSDVAENASPGEEPDVLPSLQRHGSGSRVGQTRREGLRGPVAGESISISDVRAGEPGVEGWSHGAPGEGQLPPDGDGAVSSGSRDDATGERSDSSAQARDGSVGRTPVDEDGVREPHRPRHDEQRPVKPRTVADERRSQAGRGWPTCGSCGKPQVGGWGTALKPSFEPVVVGRKPLAGTVAANVLAHGTGALNIDATRVGDSGGTRSVAGAEPNRLNKVYGDGMGGLPSEESGGRWPSNVVLDESQAAELDAQSGETQSRIGKPRAAASGDGWGMTATGAEYDDAGGASRFFPVFRYEAKAPTSERPVVDGVAHPTVKPLALMQWLVRLVTPPGGVVLDPFAGSGTTLEACVREGFDCIGIEREADYLPLIRARLSKPHAQVLDLWGGDVA